MKIYYFVFSFALFQMFVVHSYAKESVSEKTKTENFEITIEASDAALFSKTQLTNTEQNLQKPCFTDTCISESELINLSFSNENIPDTTNFNVIEYYIKSVKHLIKNIDSKSIEMLEVL